MKHDQLQLICDLRNLFTHGKIVTVDISPSHYSIGLELSDWLILVPERSALGNGLTVSVCGDSCNRVWRETNCHLGAKGYEHKVRDYDTFLEECIREVREISGIDHRQDYWPRLLQRLSTTASLNPS